LPVKQKKSASRTYKEQNYISANDLAYLTTAIFALANLTGAPFALAGRLHLLPRRQKIRS